MKWTDEQQKAIEARKGTLLVSAAAGSGKTAVLVERVIQRICDETDPCGIENLLIVTFTNAAAAQMKEKISAAVGKRIAEFPSNRHLRRQQLMLPCADICTIDKFCIKLVRENFHVLGIAPDFSLLDEGKLNILKDTAINSVIEKRHNTPTTDFMQLCELTGGSGDDRNLISAVLKLYELSMAYPFPEKMLDGLVSEFSSPQPVEASPWGKTLINQAVDTVKSAKSGAMHCLSLLRDEPELEAKYAPAFTDDAEIFDEFISAAENSSWDEIRASYGKIKFSSLSAAPRGYNSAAKTICSGIRNGYKKDIQALAKIFCISQADHEDDIKALAPVVKELISLVKDFAAEFSRLKQEENGADFSDTLHLALKLLAEPDGDGYRRTPLAEMLSENYKEILVDEYQDVNKAQDMIFSALSKNENNLFMVGDVKQSIYSFRQAMPEIFLSKRNSFEEYENGNYPSRVTLGSNFRSRRGVTETVNFIFSSIMSKNAGGLDFDEKEYSRAAASYPEKTDADAEFYLLESEKDDYGRTQAEFIADYIRRAMSGEMKISDGNTFREPKYRDFCILLRSMKGHAADFIKALTDRGIPVSCEANEGFLTAPEIMFIVSLLKIIDNPADDIPLTAVLLSPVFGFLPDDLALMRSVHRNGNIWQALNAYADDGNEKAVDFLKKITALRRLSATLRTGEFVRRLVSECSAVISASGDTAGKKANLNRFVDLANKSDSAGKGISGFVRYIDRIIRSGKDIEGGSASSEASDAVKIMTIHKSKGLEFPVCIIAKCEKEYNERDLRDDLIIAPENGIGIKRNDGNAKYDTLPRLAALYEAKAAGRSEELRVLYVALTRAKEKLVMLSSCTDIQKKLSAAAENIRDEKRIDPCGILGFSNYRDCLLPAVMRHPDANDFREIAGIGYKYAIPCDTPMIIKTVQPGKTGDGAAPADIIPEADEKTVEMIKERAEYVYPFSSLSGIVSKRIASSLDDDEICGEYFASSRPAFLSRDSLSPAQRGTATHRFMQFADYEKAGKSVSRELERLVKEGMLTRKEADAVNIEKVSGFFGSSLAKRMSGAEKVYKEYSFISAIPLSEMYPDIPACESRGEVIIIEGVADCAFVENGELVIVDYKTDRAGAAELVRKYGEQLAIYRRCLEETIGLPVKETLIYSFRSGEVIEIPAVPFSC